MYLLSAAGSTDFKVRVFSTYIKEIEAKPTATEWGAKMPFANLMTEFSNSPTGGGWIHSVSFNSTGTRLAWVGHDSSIAVADAPSGMVMMKLKTKLLPFLTLTWIGLNKILAAGHDCVPVVFQVDAAGLYDFYISCTFIRYLHYSLSVPPNLINRLIFS